jgi:phage shock protein PspC (stress-responsive transcriptional regulator)
MTKRRLERDQENQLVAGVLAGLANYFDQDPRLFRLVAIIFLILTGIFPGLLFYLIAWFMIPTKKAPEVDYDIAP